MEAVAKAKPPETSHIVLLIDTGLPKSDLAAPVTPPPGLHASLSGIALGVPVIVDGKTIVRRSDRIGDRRRRLVVSWSDRQIDRGKKGQYITLPERERERTVHRPPTSRAGPTKAAPP